MKILLIDDSATMRRIIRSHLATMGFDAVVEAHDGEQALAKLATEAVDLVITDWAMPSMSGPDLVQATETAAQKVLDETDALCATQDKLRRALAQLESVGHRSGAASRAWQDATESCEAVAAHVGAIVSAMEFQDLTAQHLTATIR